MDDPKQKMRIGAFWPIVALCTVAAIVGGILVWVLYNYGLNSQLATYIPGNAKMIRELRQSHEEAKKYQLNPMMASAEDGYSDFSIANWRTYKNEEYGFEFKYPSTGRIEIQTEQDKLMCGDSFKPLGCIRVDVLLNDNASASLLRGPEYDVVGKVLVFGDKKIIEVPQKYESEKYFWTSLDKDFSMSFTTNNDSGENFNIFLKILESFI